MSDLLQIEQLTKKYSSKGTENTVLDALTLHVQRNEFVCVLGPSGCGKSTLLRCIAGFEKYQGSIICDGEKCEAPSTDRIMVFQDYNQLFPWKTVERNVQYPLEINGLKDKELLRKRSDEALEKVGLSRYKSYYPHELSGGMKQRAAIARALALRPKLILMDEPFAALDAITRNRLQAELHRIYSQEKMTVIFITHNIQEAITLGTRLILLGARGQISIDMKNPLPKPVTPSLPGYGALWDLFSDALKEQNTESDEPEVQSGIEYE